jgi:hypothetical protein
MYNTKQFGAGLMFLVFGLGALLLSRQYPMGTATRMGPGYFPLLLSIALITIAVLTMFEARRSRLRIALGAWPIMQTFFVTAGITAFALLINTLGLVPAVGALIALGCHDRLRKHPFEIALIYVTLVAVTGGLFIYGIQLPIAFW